MIANTLDQDRVNAFAARMLDVLNGAGLALMTSIGHRTGLFDTLGRLVSGTPAAIAAEAGLNERYVREWLGAMVSGGVVEFDPATGVYRLPPEHAALLTRAATPSNLAASAQWIAVLGYAEEAVVEAFRHGRGVPYSGYRRFHEVMAEESGQTVVANLTGSILPLVPGLLGRLEAGIDVLDVGCGCGLAIQELARRFPRSRFTGLDKSEQAIASAQAAARGAGLENLRLAVWDLAERWGERAFDLITAFDVIHDQARPDRVLENIAAALRPGATFLMQDISGSGCHHTDAGHPLGTFLYTISCMHCMSVSLSAEGMGLGAMWGRPRALEMLRAAGFADVRVESLEHDPMNYYYVAELTPAATPGSLVSGE